MTVTIVTGGRDLEEHTTADIMPTKRTFNCLVEASSDQIFKVQYRVRDPHVFEGSDLRFTVYVDGEETDGTLISKAEANSGTAARASRGLQVARDMMRRYKFTDVEIVGYASSSLPSATASMAPFGYRPGMLTPATNTSRGTTSASRSVVSATTHTPVSNMDELGTIKIEVTHVNRRRTEPFRVSGDHITNVDKKKKSARHSPVSHVISLCKPEKTRPVESVWVVDSIWGTPKPAATFVFHCRSSRLLHTMLKLNLSVIEEASEEPSYRGSDSVLVDNILGADALRGRGMHKTDQPGIPPNVLADRLQDLAISRLSEPLGTASVTSFSSSNGAARIFTPSSTTATNIGTYTPSSMTTTNVGIYTPAAQDDPDDSDSDIFSTPPETTRASSPAPTTPRQSTGLNES